jgi:proteasome lid subunit RPN8/RPN11
MSDDAAIGAERVSVFLPRRWRRRLYAIAHRRAPRETGGLLVGKGWSGTALSITGVIEIPPRTPMFWRYEGDPWQVYDWTESPRSPRDRVVGMFHTHPASAPTPSAFDSRAAAAGLVHAIVGCERSRSRVRVFRRAHPDAPFREVPLVREPTPPSMRSNRELLRKS